MKVYLCKDCGDSKSRKGLYCKPCGYKNRAKTGFKVGHKFYAGGEKGWFSKGHVPWSKGKDLGGTSSHYDTLHDWVQRHRGKPSYCEHCHSTTAKRYDWSNISGEYKRELDDWQRLCRKCHSRYDRLHSWGKAKLKYRSYANVT